MKATPKSCSCFSCQRGKHTQAGHYTTNQEERAHRRAAKQALKRDGVDAVIAPAPHGTYKD